MATAPAPSARTRRPLPLRRWRCYLAPLAAIALAYWALVALYVANDPYDIYPWGPAPRVEGRFGPELTPFLIDAVLGDRRYDTLVLGGSTLVRLDPADIEALTGTPGRTFNLSYNAPRPLDRALLQERVLRQDHIRRVIVSLDWIYMLDADVPGDGFPYYLYNDTRVDDLFGLNLTGLGLLWDRLTGGTITADPAAFEAYLAEGRRAQQRYLAPAALRELAAAIEAHRDEVDRPSTRRCEDMGAVADLRRFAQRAADKGIEVTLVIPPPSLAIYYEWLDNVRKRLELGETPLADLGELWRCTVRAVDGIPGVTVVGFDDLDWITGDIGQYQDGAHLADQATYRFIAESLDDPQRALGTDKVDDYVSGLMERVRRFAIDPDALGGSQQE